MEYLEITTDQLRIGLRAEGPVDGWPCFLMHGFPYDVHAYDAVVPELVRHGARVFVPWLRGYLASADLRV